MERKTFSTVSYIRARDPSIYTASGSVLNNLRVNLAEEALQEQEKTQVQLSPQPLLKNIQVFLRMKKTEFSAPMYEVHDTKIDCFITGGKNNSRPAKPIKRCFTFSKVFNGNCSQEEIFNKVVKPKLLDIINGENSTLMTYGASGSGKTFTIMGTATQPGIIPRALEYLFGSLPRLSINPIMSLTATDNVVILDESGRTLEKNYRTMLLNTLNNTIDQQHAKTYEMMKQRLSTEPVALLDHYQNVSLCVCISFAEIYNEQIFDLLAPASKPKCRDRLQLGTVNDQIYIKNLTNVNVSSGLEAYQILQYGLHNLKYAATAINSHSSRSHCIFTVKLVQSVESDGYHVSYFNFCDLAGSERSKKTHNVGDRLNESNNINKSLLVLGRCISTIRDSQTKNDKVIIPFRESKLTMLFQRALSGKEDLAMIVNVSPCREMTDETLHALNFSAIAKQIVVDQGQPKAIKAMKDVSYYEEEIARLRELVAQLYEEVENQRLNHEEEKRLLCLEFSEDVRKFLENNDKSWEKKLELQKEKWRIEKDNALENLRDEYNESRSNNESMSEEPQAKRIKVINLDTSEEDEGF